MSETLEAEIAAPQKLALAYAPSAVRPATRALLALDARLAAIVRRRGEPMLAQMRLAWWRETLAASPDGWPLGEPVLAELARWSKPAALTTLAEGWEHLLADRLDVRAIAGFAEGRVAAFVALAAESGAERDGTAEAARTWALADLAANLSTEEEKAKVLTAAGTPAAVSLPPAMRPVAVLAALGRRSLARGGRPLLEGRTAALTAFRVGLLGR